jgi:hypothetical protein
VEILLLKLPVEMASLSVHVLLEVVKVHVETVPLVGVCSTTQLARKEVSTHERVVVSLVHEAVEGEDVSLDCTVQGETLVSLVHVLIVSSILQLDTVVSEFHVERLDILPHDSTDVSLVHEVMREGVDNEVSRVSILLSTAVSDFSVIVWLSLMIGSKRISSHSSVS